MVHLARTHVFYVYSRCAIRNIARGIRSEFYLSRLTSNLTFNRLLKFIYTFDGNLGWSWIVIRTLRGRGACLGRVITESGIKEYTYPILRVYTAIARARRLYLRFVRDIHYSRIAHARMSTRPWIFDRRKNFSIFAASVLRIPLLYNRISTALPKNIERFRVSSNAKLSGARLKDS